MNSTHYSQLRTAVNGTLTSRRFLLNQYRQLNKANKMYFIESQSKLKYHKGAAGYKKH